MRTEHCEQQTNDLVQSLGRQEPRQLPATVNKLGERKSNPLKTILPLAALATQFVDPFAQDGHKQINFSYLIYQELNQAGRTPPQTGQCAGREALTQLVFTSSTTSSTRKPQMWHEWKQSALLVVTVRSFIQSSRHARTNRANGRASATQDMSVLFFDTVKVLLRCERAETYVVAVMKLAISLNKAGGLVGQ